MEVTKTCRVAVERVLVASTRKLVFERSYSTREIVIVSAADEVGLIVNVAARDVPLRVALICAEVGEAGRLPERMGEQTQEDRSRH